MSKNRMFQTLWLLLLSVVCVLMFYYRRESTKSPQERFSEDTVVAAAVEQRTPVPLPTETPTPVPTPRPTVYEITEVFIPLYQTPVPVPATLPPNVTPAPTPIPETPAPTAAPNSVEPFSLIWFSDTQYYAYKKPEIFVSMADWAVRIREKYNALAVVCTGDIVDNRNYTRHWTNAESAITRIRDAMPFYCVAGNHDVGADSVDYTMYRQYDFCTAPETMEFNDDGHCWVLPLPEQKLLLCGVGWQNDTAYADWLIDRINAYSQYPAVLLIHSFLYDDGSLSTNGKRVEKAIFEKAPSLRLVLCGHNDGSARWSKTYGDGHTVNAIMYNFQDDKKYGLGYARILMFNPETRNIAVTTYSPYLDDYNYYRDAEKDTFTLYNAW